MNPRNGCGLILFTTVLHVIKLQSVCYSAEFFMGFIVYYIGNVSVCLFACVNTSFFVSLSACMCIVCFSCVFASGLFLWLPFGRMNS